MLWLQYGRSDFTFLSLNTLNTMLIFRPLGVILIFLVTWRASLTQHLHMAAVLQPMGLPCLWKYSPFIPLCWTEKFFKASVPCIQLYTSSGQETWITSFKPRRLFSSLEFFPINHTLQFSAAILTLYLSTISISHFEGPKPRFSLPVSLSFT